MTLRYLHPGFLLDMRRQIGEPGPVTTAYHGAADRCGSGCAPTHGDLPSRDGAGVGDEVNARGVAG